MISEPGALEGVVHRIRFESEDRAFQVAVLSVDDRLFKTVVVRNGGLTVGEHVRVQGKWKAHVSGEMQLEVEDLQRHVPTTPDGLAAYLGGGVLPGVGPALAKRIVEHFGDETMDVLDTVPERVAEVPGIGARRAQEIRDAWTERTGARDTMVFLRSIGLTGGLASRVLDRFGAGAVRVLEEDPFALARQMSGIGFRRADDIARSMGMEADDPRRVRAAAEYVLRNAESDGHSFLPRPVVVELVVELTSAEESRVTSILDELIGKHELVEEAREAEVAIYEKTVFLREERVARIIARLGRRASDPVDEDVLARTSRSLRFVLSKGQEAALRRVLGASVAVLTGGPGTGKTTIVRAAVRYLESMGKKVELAAPTGRASRRLADSTGRSARTIHRLLEYQPRERGFARNPENPIDADALIIDESSMIDLELMEALAVALRARSQLILVGDADQLPSVGAGDVFGELIRSDVCAVGRLHEVFRQEAGSRIIDCAHSILRGQWAPGDDGPDGSFYFLRANSPESALSLVERVVTERLPEAFGLAPRRDIQVIVPMRSGPVGAKEINRRIQERLRGAPVGRRGLVVGDRVMQTRNDYQKDVFNGDIGTVVTLDPDGTVLIEMEGKQVTYSREERDDLELAYAVTVHKSQGSEYPAVVVLLMTHHFKLLRRNLLYTAVTRARDRLVVVGMPRALKIALNTDDTDTRHTRLAARIRRYAGID